VAPEERARLFHAEGSRWRLKPAYRGMVRFERQNLLDLLDPAPAIGRNDYDLILCRNLLIYFHPDVGTALVSALGVRLATHGKLLLGHAESGLAAESDLAPVELGGVVAYVRDDLRLSAEEPPEGPGYTPAAPRPRPPLPPRRAPRRMPRREPVPPLAPHSPEPQIPLEDVRALLGRGETKQARALIDALKAERRSDPVLLYLEGLAALAEQDKAGAEKALRGALYLDRGFAMAHYLLAQHLLREGKGREGRRALDNAAEAVAAAEPQAAVPEGDGLTVADLRAAIRHRLSVQGSAGA
jgi:chemotaxis protein methyltransferase CheR